MMKRHATHLLPSLLLLIATLIITGCNAGSAEMSAGDRSGGNVSFGGAQDIGQFRDLLEAGEIPGENTLDSGGFFAEHYVELPEPNCGQTVCGHGMLAVDRDWLWGGYQAALQVGLNTTVDASSITRRPLDLVVVVDTSGSMAESDKMTYVKQGLHTLIDALGADDRIAIIGYSSGVEVLAELGGELPPSELHAIVDSLYPSGGTNFHDGLERGLQMAAFSADPRREQRVLMLSDGNPTVGTTTDWAILEMADGYISDGVGLTTIGVGRDFNVELMRGLAERGAGNFYFVEDTSAIDEVFRDELRYFAVPIAFDVEIEVIAAPGYQLGEVVGTKLWSAAGQVGNISIPSLFLASRTDASGEGGRRGGGSAIIVELLADSQWAGSDGYSVAEIRISYRDAATGETHSQVVTVDNPALPGEFLETQSEQEAWVSHQAMRKNYAMYNMFRGLREATRHAMWNYDYALWVLERLEAMGSRWNARYQDADIEADLLLVDLFIGNLTERGAVAADPGQPYLYDDHHAYDYDYHYQGCSAAGGSQGTGAMLLLFGILALLYRRRRRAAA